MDSLPVIATLAVAVVMVTLWAIGRATRNYGLVDLGWAANFVLLAGLIGALGEGWGPRRWLIASLYALWSLRLTLHLARRIVGHPEDARYARLRSTWAGPSLDLKFLLFFLAQGLLNLLLVVPLAIAARNPSPGFHWLELAAAALWLAALTGESLADRQLAGFKATAGNAKRVCDVGLWSWSRHPNYFFEATIWVAYATYALVSPGGAVALFAPALMIYLLLEVTGVKPTEHQAVLSRGEAYRDYQRRVSRFVPWPPGALAGSDLAMRLLATGRVPDALIRRGIRRLLAQRLDEEGSGTLAEQQARHMRFLRSLRTSPLAIHTQAANEQHYEVPATFFENVLGPRLKYSGALFEPAGRDARRSRRGHARPERATRRPARWRRHPGAGLWLGLADAVHGATFSRQSHHRRVELAFAADVHPRARRERRGLRNVEIVTCDVNALDFADERRFDRVVSVEMFEHMRNYEQLFAGIARWLRPRGTLFVHIFTHLRHAYPFDVRDSSDWMARHFFTGGIMPSDRPAAAFPGRRCCCRITGTWTARTTSAPPRLAREHGRQSERHRADAARNLRRGEARRWWEYWRVFFMACAELWGYADGQRMVRLALPFREA